MPTADPFPAVAGRMFYCLDRLAPPGEIVTAEEPVPGHPQIWVVRTGGGHKVVCPLSALSDVPPDRLYRALRESVP